MDNIAKALTLFAPFSQVIQTLLWIAVIILAAIIFRSDVQKIIDAIIERIKKGSPIKAGPLELGADLQNLKQIGPVETEDERKSNLEIECDQGEKSLDVKTLTPDWAQERDKIYQDNKGIFLTHVISPSSLPGQRYDIYIYLVRHKSRDFCDIDRAEFFFGRYWGNQIFEAEKNNSMIGVHTSAYGPFLCTCRVYFKDGSSCFIYRYIDFEMGRVFKML